MSNLVIGIVGLSSSNSLRFKLEKSKFSESYHGFQNSMKNIIEKFDGIPLSGFKKGDQKWHPKMFFYFPKNSGQNDKDYLVKCLDCGLAMINEAENLNKSLNLTGRTTIDYMVTANYGRVTKNPNHATGLNLSANLGKNVTN